ncbi:hypothetical protein Golax_013035, partial [Gossypium laxum]|nr:hypothetical protein [Gossypium laxum]
LLHSIVNGGRNLSSFHYSFARYFNTVSNHMETLSENSMSFRRNPKTYHLFDNVDDALTLFNEMIEQHPKRSIVEFTKLLVALLGVKPDVVTFSTLIKGLCNRSKISQAVSLFDEMIEKGYQPDLIVYTSILNGLCYTRNTD